MSHKILIVDDDADQRSIIRHCLEDKNFDVVEAVNGKDALKKLDDFNPEVILLDIMMPEMDGFETCKRLRDLDSTRDTPIIFLTACTDDWDLLTGFVKGCDIYLTKPFSMEILERELSKILTV